MKKVVLAILIVAVSSICDAQRIKVHQGNHINSFMMSEVDSITHDGNESVTVYYNSQQSNFSVNNVDSLSINSERLECYNISSEQLNGWDEGISCTSSEGRDFYIVSKTDTIESNDEVINVCVSSFENEDIHKTVVLNFDTYGNLYDIVYCGYEFKVVAVSDSMTFVGYDTDGLYMGNFTVPHEELEFGDVTEFGRRKVRMNRPFWQNSKGRVSLPTFTEKESLIRQEMRLI